MEVVAIIGSREWPDPKRIQAFIDTLSKNTVVITGGWWNDLKHEMTPTRGVDRIAAEYARNRGFTVVLVGADFAMHGKSAGMRRNPVTVGLATRVVAFWDQKSNGTKNSIEHARRLGKEPEIITPEGP